MDTQILQLKKHKLSVFVITIAMMVGLLSACEESTIGTGLSSDISEPVVSIENVNQGDTLKIDYSFNGNFVDVRILDETNLKSYHIEISDSLESVIELTNQALGTNSVFSLDLSSLTTNKYYDAEITVVDAADNASTLKFLIIIFKVEAVTDYEQLFVVGTATNGGYDLTQQSPMSQDRNNPNIYTWSDTLNIGEFKIKTYATEDFCAGDWIHPTQANAELSNTTYTIENGCAPENPDYKWVVEVPGIYTITLNFIDQTIQIEQDVILGERFDEVYLVGSASPGGWSLADQTEFSQNPQNEFQFNWTGTLTAGEFKFKLYAAEDFCAGKWIHPKVENQVLTAPDFDILVGCADDNPDYKWVITEGDAGDYSIQINMASRAISIQKN